MSHPFELASGSVLGTRHAETGTNNQDARCILQTKDVLIVVVCDGCSGGLKGSSHNEVGAQIGARMLASMLSEKITLYGRVGWLLLRKQFTDNLETLLGLLQVQDDDASAFIDHLLFTSLVLVATERRTEIAAVGDGLVILNGAILPLKPVVKNQPDYLAYNLSPAYEDNPIEFEVLASLPTQDMQSFLIGTDGCLDLLNAEKQALPGGVHAVGPISDLWTEDRFFGENEDVLRRHLLLTQGGVQRSDVVKNRVWRYPGLLPDDTTLVTGRRKQVIP